MWLLVRWFVLPVVIFALGFGSAWKVAAWRNGASQTKAVVRVVKVVQAQGAVNQTVSTAQQAAQDRIVYRTRTLIKEVPLVLPPATDARYPLVNGFVRLHDLAATGGDLSAVPESSSLADDAASDVTASQAAGVIVANYGSCRAAFAQLQGWQDWYRGQQAAYAKH